MSGIVVTRDTLLVRRPDITIHVSSSGEVSMVCEGARAFAGTHALSILDAFSEPRTLAEVTSELAARSARDFAFLATTILELARQGILTTPGAHPVLGSGMGWDASSIHARMLGDTQRTEAFLAALSEVARKDDVVVDIGTGTGVLALGAARAGARRVFGVEASGIADFAEQMFHRNRASDRVELIRGWSTRITLPERATVMVSETIGNQALGENIVETVLDAQKRLLAPDARLIPSRIRIYAQPCTLPELTRDHHVFSRRNVATWGERYGIDFTSLIESVGQRPFMVTLPVGETRGWIRLAPPTLLVDIDLSAPEGVFERQATATIEAPGEMNAVVEFFELALSPSVRFSADPDTLSDACSWRIPSWMLPEPVRVAKGDVIKFGYRYASGCGKLSIA